MKKVLFVVTEMRLGGRERVVGRIADSLSKQVDVKIFSVWRRKPFFSFKTEVVFGNNRQNLKVREGEKNQLLIFLRDKLVFPIVRRIFTYDFLQRQRISALIEYINQNKVDVVVLTDLTMTFAKRIQKECPKTKLIGWVHMETEAFFNIQYDDFKNELIRSMRLLNRIIVLTKKEVKKMSSYTGENVEYIPNPMPKRSKYQSTLNNKIITMVCRIDYDTKGLDFIPRIMEKIPKDWSLEIAGSGSEKDELQFKKDISLNPKIKNKIRWTSAIDGEDLDKFFQNGSVFLMTSRREGFPLTLGEAMAHGLPVVAFDIDGTRAVTKNGEYGLLAKLGDVNEIVGDISSVAKNINIRKELSEKSLLRINDFSIEKISNSWKILVTNSKL